MKKILSFLYPFLIAIYPVLALRNFNIIYVDLASIVRTLVIVLIITAIVWLISYVVLRKIEVAGIITSLTMVIVIAYGHIYIQIENTFGKPIRHTLLAALIGGLFILCCWLLLQR